MIYCCKGCEVPKRYPGCHGSCSEYLAEKTAHDHRKAEYDRERQITGAIHGDRSDKVYKALKDRRNKKI